MCVAVALTACSPFTGCANLRQAIRAEVFAGGARATRAALAVVFKIGKFPPSRYIMIMIGCTTLESAVTINTHCAVPYDNILASVVLLRVART